MRELIWSDDFAGDQLDPGRWTASEDCWGGGNRERQCYTASPANVSVSDGLLRLTARREAVVGRRWPQGDPRDDRVGRRYSSARIHTRGKASFFYGRIEVRARLPKGQGVWPAVWMLPEHDNYGAYPRSGEIDILEAVNPGVACEGCEDRIHGALHHGPAPEANQHRQGSTRFTELDGFHVFALDWTPDRLTWLLDGEPFFSAEGGPPFDQRFHLILNVAVGGPWAEGTGATGVDPLAFPQEMLVDWVRVYGPPTD